MMIKAKGLMAGSMLGAALIACPAMAATTGTVNLTSEYVFRGITSSDGAAVQGSLDWSEGGWYAGAWGSNTAPFAPDGTELDLYGGYKFNLSEGVVFDVGLIYYLFPESEQGFLGAPAFDADYLEVAAGFTWGGLAGKVYYADEFFGDIIAGGNDDSLYFNLAYTFGISETVALKAALGYQTGDGAENIYGDDVLDYSLSLTKTLDNGFAASFALVGTDLDGAVPVYGSLDFNDDPKVLISLSKGFEL